eukprot:GHVT01018902.1.p1 GENE.GHVT01018902.1~~GHVT01018902.1.p1  ORF type:complete len:139 (-),score=2.49 GHVT01018902.1:639-1055(-)
MAVIFVIVSFRSLSSFTPLTETTTAVFAVPPYPSPTPSTVVTLLGIALRTVPTIVRLCHVFTFCQIVVFILNLWILPECNSSALRWLFGFLTLQWWGAVIVGVASQRRLWVPPELYDAPRKDMSIPQDLAHLLRGFGP